ncbi:hypothetical protein OROHE_019717 [Orobanche hederae]
MGNFFTSTRSKVKELPKTIVEIKANVDCDGCEHNVRKSFEVMKGVEKVDIDRNKSHVQVVGKVDPKKVLKRVQKTRPRAVFWPKPNKDDPKKAPPIVYVGNGQAIPLETITNLFSDENPNACSIM